MKATIEDVKGTFSVKVEAEGEEAESLLRMIREAGSKSMPRVIPNPESLIKILDGLPYIYMRRVCRLYQQLTGVSHDDAHDYVKAHVTFVSTWVGTPTPTTAPKDPYAVYRLVDEFGEIHTLG